jgi:hypothetical protein
MDKYVLIVAYALAFTFVFFGIDTTWVTVILAIAYLIMSKKSLNVGGNQSAWINFLVKYPSVGILALVLSWGQLNLNKSIKRDAFLNNLNEENLLAYKGKDVTYKESNNLYKQTKTLYLLPSKYIGETIVQGDCSGSKDIHSSSFKLWFGKFTHSKLVTLTNRRFCADVILESREDRDLRRKERQGLDQGKGHNSFDYHSAYSSYRSNIDALLAKQEEGAAEYFEQRCNTGDTYGIVKHKNIFLMTALFHKTKSNQKLNEIQKARAGVDLLIHHKFNLTIINSISKAKGIEYKKEFEEGYAKLLEHPYFKNVKFNDKEINKNFRSFGDFNKRLFKKSKFNKKKNAIIVDGCIINKPDYKKDVDSYNKLKNGAR